MDKVIRKKILLGILVSIGMLLLLGGIFLIGTKQDMFTPSITVMTVFKDVGGLRKGDYIRFAGVKVGVVSQVKIINDTSVIVSMRLQKEMKDIIRKDARVYLASDGLMGSKIIKIKPSEKNRQQAFIDDLDTLRAVNPLNMENITDKLLAISDNALVLTKNLSDISVKMNNGSGIFQALISDTIAAQDLRYILGNIKTTSRKSVEISDHLIDIMALVENGEGTAGLLLSDTTLANEIKQIMNRLNTSSRYIESFTSDLSGVMREKGTIQALMKDTVMAEDVRQSILQIKESSERLNENMEALQHNILLRRYFRKQQGKPTK